VIGRALHGLCGLSLALPLSLAGPASAQVKASASLDSDYRFRGLSFSDSKPVIGLNLAYDHDSGVYVGGSAVIQATGADGLRTLRDTVYAGYARRWGPARSWDVGVSHTDAAFYDVRRHVVRYSEVYAGLAQGDLAAHVYYSPDYYGSSVGALYAEINDAMRPALNWRLFGHVGYLRPEAGPGALRRRPRYDFRAGVARQLGPVEVRLAWTAATPRPQPHTPQNRPALVLGATYFF
jgi:uncharacterized protein (TIGR02001 family)